MKVNDFPTFPNNANLTRGTRVKLSGGYLLAAGATEDELGTIADDVQTTDEVAAVVPFNFGGVKQMVCSAAVTQYATVFAAASGRVAATGTLRRGIALQAGSAAGAIIDVLVQGGSAAVT